MKKKIFTLVSLSILTLVIGVFSSFNLTKNEVTYAADYYQNADLSSKENLYKSLNKIINDGWIKCSYENLTKKLKTVDLDVDGLDYRHIKNRIVDMYSNITNFKPEDFGSYKDEGDAWNREHLIVQSWWVGNENGPNGEGGDAFNMFPTDGKINNMRGTYPMGIVDPNKISKRSANNFSLLGKSDSSTGYSGVVFEPNDEYKGDIARSYFYFATKNLNGSLYTQNEGKVTFSESEEFMLTDYARKLFLSWNELDPVSRWERQRCENIYNYQKNRNPYIDHPEWANFIWGEEEPPIGEDIKVNSIVLSKEEISLNVDAIKEISATIYPSDAKNKEIQWSSSDDNIATVNDGEIKGITPGDVTITCASLDGSNIVNRCLVHVISKDQPLADNDEIKMSLDEYPGISSYNWYGISSLEKEDIGQMYAYSDGKYLQFNPNKAGKGIYSYSPIQGISSIQISSNLESGSATWRLRVSKTPFDETNTTTLGEEAGSVTVGSGDSKILTPSKSVNAYPYFSLYTDSLSKIDNIHFVFGEGQVPPIDKKVTGVSLSARELSIEKGNTSTLVANVIPMNSPNDGFIYSSSDSSKVSVNNSGVITANEIGEATITVKVKNTDFIDTCLVKVTPPETKVISISLNIHNVSINNGTYVDLVVRYNPENATNKGVIYSSSDENIAKVDNNGHVIGYNEGSCVITATYTFDPNIKDSCNVTVNGSSGSGVNMPLVIGLSVGGGVLLLVGILVVVLVVTKKV